MRRRARGWMEPKTAYVTRRRAMGEVLLRKGGHEASFLQSFFSRDLRKREDERERAQTSELTAPHPRYVCDRRSRTGPGLVNTNTRGTN